MYGGQGGGEVTLTGRVIGATICLALAAALAWPAVTTLLKPPVASLPEYIRAAEGEVMIDADFQPRGMYTMRLNDERILTLHCAPQAATGQRPCLQDALKTLGQPLDRSYRLTVSYGAERLADGRMRNIMIRAMAGEVTLFTPEDQLWFWTRRGVLFDTMGEPEFLFMPGLFALVGFWEAFKAIGALEERGWRRRRRYRRR